MNNKAKLLLENSVLEKKANIHGILHVFAKDMHFHHKFDILDKDQIFGSLLQPEVLSSVENCNMLVVDDGGNELFVLKQLGSAVQNFDFLYVTVYSDYIKPNCVIINHVDKYLCSCGFYRSEAVMTCEKWGEALYEKK